MPICIKANKDVTQLSRKYHYFASFEIDIDNSILRILCVKLPISYQW